MKATSVDRCRSIIENFVGIYYQTDMRGIITDISPSCFVLFGWKPEELIGHQVTEMYNNPEERKVFLEKLAKEGKVSNYELTLLGRDGKSIIAAVSARLVKNDRGGEPQYIEGTIRDISAQKALEHDLRVNQKRFQLLTEKLTDVIYILNINTWEFTYVSHSVERIFGYSKEEALTLEMKDVMTPESYKRQLEVLTQALQTAPELRKKSEIFELELIRKDGSTFWGEINAGIITDDAGTPTDILGVMRDITDRKNAEERLKAAENRYRLLFDLSLDAIATIEPPTWKCSSANLAMLKLFNIPKIKDAFSEFVFWDLAPQYQPDGKLSLEKAMTMIKKAMKEGLSSFEWEASSVSGANFPTAVLLNRITINNKIFLLVTTRDISKQKEVEKELRKKVLDLEELNNVMVGRELKMLELKEQIDRLSKKT